MRLERTEQLASFKKISPRLPVFKMIFKKKETLLKTKKSRPHHAFMSMTHSHQPNSADASAHQLMARIQEIESRRRITMMHAKEMETKVQFSSEEQTALRCAIQSVAEKEALLKRTMEFLADEQRQLQSDCEMQQRRLIAAQNEEPLLMASTMDALKVAETVRKSRSDDLETLRSAAQPWDEHRATTADLNAKINAAKADIDNCQQQSKLLELEISELRLEQQRVAEAIQQRKRPLTTHCAPTSESPAATFLTSQIECLKRSSEDTTQQNQRQRLIVAREVKELLSRVSELQQSTSDLTAQQQELETHVTEMIHVMTDKRCPSCCASSEQAPGVY